ncbi:MAG: hypothetical protein RMJ38_06910 [candidate division WOR-3 bacterium]|nr:hypothetical protein [candidate division WOR-3 bacterium]MDW8151151.1 hypothetical protein [candidate division WOR-3 bacterium]
MRKLYLLLTIAALGMWACARDEEEETHAPENLKGVAVNQGADLKLEWTWPEPEHKPDKYVIQCDGSTIAPNVSKDSTNYTIQGSQYVCKQVRVIAVMGSEENGATLDLTPDQKTLTLYRTDYNQSCPPATSWAKITFGSTVSASTICQTQVDKNAPNTGYFAYVTGNELKDASATGVGPGAKYEIAFTQSASGNLAPGTGNYNTARGTSDGAKHFYWADNTSTGYGQIDVNDYFGRIDVSIQQDQNGFKANLTIYTQNKVPGLRWVKP